MKKEVKLKGCIKDGKDFVDGLAIIGGGPVSEPWVNLYHRNGDILAALNKSEMDRVVRAWIKARGGFPI